MANTANGKLNFGENDTYTISAWIYSYDFTSDRYLVGKGNYQYDLKIKDQQVNFTQYSSQQASGTQSLSSSPARFQWCLITGVRKGNSQYLYVNGVCADSSAKVVSEDSTGNTSNDFEVGVKSDSSSTLKTYYGKIDEVRISNRTLGPDWIKLSYMNQKETDQLVQFK
jgi:beta-galactosidase